MEILGVDIGGSGIKGAPVNTETGTLQAERYRLSTPQPATPEAIAETLVEVVKHFNWSGKIGCGFPAVVQNGYIKTAVNIDSRWINVNAAQLFMNATNCPIQLLNDADAAGLAEIKFGAGQHHPGTILMLTVGTGIGTALFSKGILYPNMELGQIVMNGKIAEKYAADSVRKKKDLSWKEWAKRFDEYLHYLERLFRPELFIVGGGISKKADKYHKYFTTDTEIVCAKLLNQAGIIGAALAGASQSSVTQEVL